MFAEADTAQGTNKGGDDEIRRIGNGPEEKDKPEIDTAVQLTASGSLRPGPVPCAEDIAHDDKGQDIADDLTSPGNEDARQEAEQDAIGTVTNWTDGRPVMMVRR